MPTRLLAGGGLVLGVVLLLAVNILSGATLRSARVDLTEQKLYTLSPGSRKILEGLEEPVTLRLFLSKEIATRLPGISAYAVRVEELLDEYRRASRGNLRLSVIDPEPFSEDEDRAVGYGLQGVPLSDGESTFYFGLVGSGATEEEAVIPFLSREREEFLEYDITKLVYQVAHPKKVVVGLLSGLDMSGMGTPPELSRRAPQPWVVLDQMRQLFEVRELEQGLAAVPEEVNVLMLVHPHGWSEKTLYAIDQFVLRGGRALVFLDPDAQADQGESAGLGGMGPKSSDLGPLLAAWGIQWDPGKVVGDLQLAEKVQFNRGGRPAVVDFPVWINLGPEQLDSKDIVTANLGSVLLATPGRVQAKDGAGTQLVPLMRTSKSSMEMEAFKVGLLADPQQILRDFRPSGEPYILAARVTGKVQSAFAEGPPKAAEEDKAELAEDEAGKPKQAPEAANAAPHLKESKEDINLIVVADSDLLQDRFWVTVQDLLGTRIATPTAANGSLVVNALDNLTGSNDLISVRNRGQFSRPFTRVNALREEAELQFRAKEQQLLDRLRQAETRLTELERGKPGGNAMILSAAQQQELERFRQEKVQTRTELRQVRHELQRSIDSLEAWTKFINIGLVPLLVGAGGVAAGWQRTRRRRRSAELATGKS